MERAAHEPVPPRGFVLAGIKPGPEATRVIVYAARQAVIRHADGLRLLHAGVEDPAQTGWLASHAEDVRADFPGLPVDTLVQEAEASAALIEQAATARLVVVGPPGRGLSRLLNRSVAFGVAGGASCPVTVLRDWPARGGPVTAAVGDPARDRTVLETAAGEADLRHTALLILHADMRPQPLPPGLAPPGQQSQKGVLLAERRFLQEEAAFLRGRWPGLTTDIQVASSAAPLALLQTSRDAALLVIGGPRRGHRIRPGSTTSELLRHGQCPVMVVPRRPDRRSEGSGRGRT
ncbi:universal stress protein [Streptomyces sp. NPDC040724]|uniref:universal stress protein n=1 Tax=unclassified Streptomyces TaxID=2593676 RepID=UPI0033C83839